MQNFFALLIRAYLILHKGVISLALAALTLHREFYKCINHMKLVTITARKVLFVDYMHTPDINTTWVCKYMKHMK